MIGFSFLNGLAHLFYNWNNELSLIFCNLAIKLGIKQSNIFKLKGDILFGMDDFEGAYECYCYASYFDNNADTINDIAVTMEYLENYEKALEFYNESLKCDPNNILTLNNRTILFIKLKRYDEALADINKVLEIDENNVCAIENKEKIRDELNK